METAVYTHDEKGKRVDVHRPSVINPGDYEYVSVSQRRKAVKEGANPHSGGPAGTCHHCGKWIVWEVNYRHIPSGNLMTFGYICAGILDLTDNRIDHEMVLLQRACANEKKKWEFENSARLRLEKFQAEHPDVFNYLNNLDPDSDDRFLQSVRFNLQKWGNLWPNQIEAVRRVKAAKEARAIREAEEAAKLATAPALQAGVQTIEGEIISTRWDQGYTGESVLKMLVRLDNGNKVFGTAPAKVRQHANHNDDAMKGLKVSFVAEVKPKIGEDHFGYYKSPKQVKVV